jgi:hypothetical protein
MPNHFHFLIHIPELFCHNKFSDSLKICLSSYSQAINIQEERSGSLFQQHTKFKCLTLDNGKSEDYALICFNYIHQNPLTSGIVLNMEDWPYSSFNEYAGKCKPKFCKKEIAFEYLGVPRDYNAFYKFSYDIVDKNKINNLV